MPVTWLLVYGVVSFRSPEHVMKDTAYLEAKFPLDNGTGMAAKGQSLCTSLLVPWVLKSKGTSEAIIWGLWGWGEIN